jgi:hypothetical protein
MVAEKESFLPFINPNMRYKLVEDITAIIKRHHILDLMDGILNT